MAAKIPFSPSIIAASIAMASLLSACGGGGVESPVAAAGSAATAAAVTTPVATPRDGAVTTPAITTAGGLASESASTGGNQAVAGSSPDDSAAGVGRATAAAAIASTLSATPVKLVASSDAGTLAAGALWLPMKEYDLTVTPGTALDLSGPLQGYSARGMCMNWVLESMSPLGSATAATTYVNEIKRRGYNLVRLHGIDAALMQSGTVDANINAGQLDSLFRLIAELGKQGIGYTMDAQSYKTGWVNNTAVNAKSRIHYDPRYQAAWKKAVDRIFDTVNPYNGVTIAKDPNLKVIVGINEGSIAMVAGVSGGKFDDGLKPGFNAWLMKKYGSVEAFRAAWSAVALAAGEDPSLGGVALPLRSAGKTRREDDFGRFMAETEMATASWMRDYLAAKGAVGKFSNANSCQSWGDTLARSQGDAITFNNYHDHPSGDGVGSSIVNNSAFDTMGAYLRGAAGLRYHGRNFYATEFSQPFWNKYRYESGAMSGAFAAHQGWNGLCSFGHQLDATAYQNPPKWDHLGQIRSFFNWGDPILTASDRIAAFLYRRGDVWPARFTVAYTARPDKMLDYRWGASWMMSWTPAVANMSFISKIAQITPDQTDGNRNWTGSGTAPNFIKEPLLTNDELTPTPRAAFAGYAAGDAQWYETAARVREAGMLYPNNQTDAVNGLVQSDTNQTIWDFRNRALRVVTPKTEVLTFDSTVVQGNVLSIGRFTPGATVAAIALDNDQALTATSRILLTHVTDARNTNMKFTDSTAKTLAAWGTLPVLMRGSVIEARLAISGNWTLYALDARGNRVETRPVTVDGNGVSFKLDNTIGGKGPAVYYELVRQ
ncbi:hypothetical protein [Derxia lacustris]|uniref:hypothetical protein n=1 Tax=Derxia lacustris TaxID=764842 RepID=UPI00111C1C82|nr:hypothetical protein [Derxia lacustris]